MSTKSSSYEILKVPVQLEGFSWRKTTQDWGITFCLQPENLEHGQPLQGKMNEHFIMVLVKVKDQAEGKELLEDNELDNLEIGLGG